MIIGERLRLLREQKGLSQGQIEKRSGLLRHYVSRVENGHTVPAIETLEKMARALEIPMYQLFYDGEEPPPLPPLPVNETADGKADYSRKGVRQWGQFLRALSQAREKDRRLLMGLAHKMAQMNRSTKAKKRAS